MLLIATYILKCADSTYYTGISKDVAKRFQQHLSGHCHYTRLHVARSIEWVYFSEGYAQARKLEKYIKKVGAKKFLYAQGVYF